MAGGHPIGVGLSGYWTANVVTLTSGGRDAMRPVRSRRPDRPPVMPRSRTTGSTRPRSRVDFVVLSPGVPGVPGVPGYPGFTDRQAVLAAFGKPSRTYHVGQDTILWWPKNLLPDVG